MIITIDKQDYILPENVAHEIIRLRKCESVAKFVLSRMSIDSTHIMSALAFEENTPDVESREA